MGSTQLPTHNSNLLLLGLEKQENQTKQTKTKPPPSHGSHSPGVGRKPALRSWDQAEGTENCEFGFGVKQGIQQQVGYLEDLGERSSKECQD